MKLSAVAENQTVYYIKCYSVLENYIREVDEGDADDEEMVMEVGS